MEKQRVRISVLRDCSLLLLLVWAFLQAMLMSFTGQDNRIYCLVFLILCDAAVLEGFLGSANLCFALSGTLTCAWVSYKLYMFYTAGVVLTLVDYLMIPMPIIGAAAAAMFRQGSKNVDVENVLLRRRVEELTLVDEITGLYNLRALNRDLSVMIHYGKRNDLPISLMILQPRYEQELRRMLPTRMYTGMLQKMASVLTNCIRVEDRAYVIDEHGTFAVVLTTTEQDSAIVRGRVLKAMSADGVFDGILDRGTKLDLRFACKQYDEEKFGNDLMGYKRATENELVYDV